MYWLSVRTIQSSQQLCNIGVLLLSSPTYDGIMMQTGQTELGIELRKI